MTRPKLHQNNFPKALKTIRTSKKLSQEAFSLASSRTYISYLEHGTYTPTLNKVDELAEVLDVHPLTLLTLSYMKRGKGGSAAVLLDRVLEELSGIDNP